MKLYDTYEVRCLVPSLKSFRLKARDKIIEGEANMMKGGKEQGRSGERGCDAQEGGGARMFEREY